MKPINLIILAIILTISGNTSAQIKIGILPRLAPTELTKMFSPLAEYIEKETNNKVELIIPKDFDTYMEMMKSGKFDYAFSNPNVYTQARKILGNSVEPLAISVETGSGKSFTGCFLVKKGSPIKQISDFKGKKMIFVDEKSAGGYISQVGTLMKNGITKKDVNILPFAKKHTNVALAVQNGTVDIGGIRTADFEKIKKQVNISDIEILSESEPIPNWPFYVLPNAKKDISEKVNKAISSLSPGNQISESILKSAKLDGFVPASDSDFDSMRNLNENVSIF